MYSIGNNHDWKASNEHNIGDADANRIQMVQLRNGMSLNANRTHRDRRQPIFLKINLIFTDSTWKTQEPKFGET